MKKLEEEDLVVVIALFNMKIYRAVKSNYITQRFYENLACCKLDEYGNPIIPFKIKGIWGGVCPIGYGSFYNAIGMKAHGGTDFATWYKEPCFFNADFGVKWYVQNHTDGSGGKGIDIISKEKVTLNGRTDYIKFRFWHMYNSNVLNGQEVKFGDFIGRCDSTGASGGNHLHFGSKWCDKNGSALDKGNGYNGNFDHEPFSENIFALDILKKKNEMLSVIDLANKVIFEARQYIKKHTKKIGRPIINQEEIYSMETKKWWASSADPKKVSLSIKGFGVAVIPAIVLIGRMLGWSITATELTELVNAVAVLASSAMVLFGLLRKFYYKFAK